MSCLLQKNVSFLQENSGICIKKVMFEAQIVNRSMAVDKKGRVGEDSAFFVVKIYAWVARHQ